MREYAGVSGEDQERFRGLRIDRVPLPFDVHPRIQSRANVPRASEAVKKSLFGLLSTM
jgi:hypothetical protein